MTHQPSGPEPAYPWLDPLLSVAAVAIFALTFVWDSSYPGIALAGLTASAVTTDRGNALKLCAFLLVIATTARFSPAVWVLPAALGVGTFAAVAVPIRRLRSWHDWLRVGR